MNGMDFWRLCDELNVIQAALLFLGRDPSDLQYSVESSLSKRPEGYEAIRTAIANAVIGNRLPAMIRYREIPTSFEEKPDIDWHATTFLVEDLKAWLKSRGVESGFFFSGTSDAPAYLNAFGDSYAPKLAAAVEAWNAVNADPSLRKSKTVKQALMVWLRLHAPSFGLTKEDGSPNEQGIEEVAKIANWDPKGGAPKTPGNE